MLSLPLVIAAVATLLVLVGLTAPLAERLRLPHSVLLALLGILIGAGASFLLFTPLTDRFNQIARVVVFLPFSSDLFLFVFLPALLFQAALSLDVRRLRDDAGPILLLAVIAVAVATLAIGFALRPVSGQPLLVCLLLGSIVATTDPVAVLAIFRDLGVPARLMRLVEGESLLNDAAAIALFSIFLGAIVSGRDITVAGGIGLFLVSATHGVVVGLVGGLISLVLMRATQHLPAALVTVSIGMPYLIYVTAELLPETSGVIAVVTAGATLAREGPLRIQPSAWQHLRDIWQQLDFWAGSMIFLLAALIAPRMLKGIDWSDIVSLGVLIVAAFAARAVVLWGPMPLLSLAGLSQRVPAREKTVILWGGLRGAVTLALALSVGEHSNDRLSDAQHFIQVLATGFTLFTLVVNGTTLRLLMRLLRLDRLSPYDAGLRDEVLALALGNVRSAVVAAAEEHEIDESVAREAIHPYDVRIAEATARAGAIEDISDRDRLTFGLVALADRERAILMSHYNDATVSAAVATRLLGIVHGMKEGARADGRVGYRRAAAMVIAYSVPFRIALRVQRHTGYARWLEHALAERFERLLVARIVLTELMPFPGSRIRAVLGERIADLLGGIMAMRREQLDKALEALRLTYPAYAGELERRFLTRIARRREQREYESLAAEQLIGTELLTSLETELREETERMNRTARLDLRMDTRELIANVPLFQGLTGEQRDRIARLVTSRFAVPGDRLIHKGERGTSMFFIASGAVEVYTGEHRVRLGRGDFIGEMALLYHQPRSADVTAIGYCQLLVLDAEPFRALLAANPDMGREIERVALERLDADRAAPIARQAAAGSGQAGLVAGAAAE